MEIELLLRETLRQGEFFHGNNLNCHRLKFVEELMNNDGEDQKLCAICYEPAMLGPFFECSICQIVIHVSCFRGSQNYESTLCLHFGKRHDHDQLIFTEELQNDAEGEEAAAVCIACQEEVESAGYKCSAPECKFLLHKSCSQLPHQMQHPSHPSHILILKVPTETFSYCNACGKWCSRCLFYSCCECNFNLDVTCVTRTRINVSEDCQHEFLPLFKQIHFTCETCGEEGTDFASQCTVCRLFFHSRCSEFPSTMDISRHDHVLTLVNSLHLVKDSDHVLFCKICGQKVNKDYASYYCQECDFVAHLHCTDAYRFASARVYRVSRSNEHYLPENIVDGMEINHGEIQHFSHPHDLILSYEEVQLHDKLCDCCMHFIISGPFYNCTQCNFFLHTWCAQLPKMKKHLLHRHTLMLLSNAPDTDGVFTCNACAHSRHGFVYRCSACGYNLDAHCFSIPETLKHEGHGQHTLILPVNSSKNCNACDRDYKHSKDNGVFVCTNCNFALGFECATLPPVAMHKYDEHSLALTNIIEDNSEEYYCLICEEERDPKHWFYYCAECKFPAHPQCVLGKYPFIKFGTTYKDEHHQHPLTFVRKTEYSRPCDACWETFDGMALECTQCKFIVHRSSKCVQKISDKVLHP